MPVNRIQHETLDKTYKVTKIVCLVIGVLALASTTIAGVAVGHYRVEALHTAQEKASTEREKLREEIRSIEHTITSMETDVKWIRQSLEKKP